MVRILGMRSNLRLQTALWLIAIAVGRSAAADEQAATTPPLALSVPTESWQAVINQPVVLKLVGGAELAATPIAFDEHTVTLTETGTGRVISLSRDQVLTLTLVPTAAPAANASPSAVESAAVQAREWSRSDNRHIGLQIFAGPGNLMIDFDYRPFYGFVGSSFGYPFIFSGHYGAGAIGLGGTWRFSLRSNWSVDVFGMLLPTWWDGFSCGIGAGFGFHYTSPIGFTVAFKIPFFGLAPGNIFSNSYSGNSGSINSGSTLIGYFFMEAGMSLPIISMGYRF